MDKEPKISTREDLINELIFVSSVKEAVWEYHPNNPNKIDVEKYYSDVCQEIMTLNTLIEALDDEN